MIKEAYCSYEVSKLLKEKGFDEECFGAYTETNHNITMFTGLIKNSEYGNAMYTAPTHQMACAWLREKHNILISIIPQEIRVGFDKLCYAIYRITEDVYTPLYNGYINNLVDSKRI